MSGKSTRALLGALALPIALGALAEVSLAEEVLPLEKGMKVRLKRTPPPAGSSWGASAAERAAQAVPSGDWVVGELQEVTSDSLRFTLLPSPSSGDGSGGEVSVPKAAVKELEVSRGMVSNTKKGAWIGLAAGGGVAAILLIADSGDEFLSGGLVVAVVGLFAGGGAAAGALVGSQIKTEDWDEAPKPWSSIAVLPRPGGAAVAATWHF